MTAPPPGTTSNPATTTPTDGGNDDDGTLVYFRACSDDSPCPVEMSLCTGEKNGCVRPCAGDFEQTLDADGEEIAEEHQCLAHMPTCVGYDKATDTLGTCKVECSDNSDCPSGLPDCVGLNATNSSVKGYCEVAQPEANKTTPPPPATDPVFFQECAVDFGKTDKTPEYICPEALPTCVGYEATKHFGRCERQCAGDFEQTKHTDGAKIDGEHQCLAHMPTCVGYVKDTDTWGTCKVECSADADCPAGRPACVGLDASNSSVKGYCELEHPAEPATPPKKRTAAEWFDDNKAVLITVGVFVGFLLITTAYRSFQRIRGERDMQAHNARAAANKEMLWKQVYK